jgi:hypothetical protein
MFSACKFHRRRKMDPDKPLVHITEALVGVVVAFGHAMMTNFDIMLRDTALIVGVLYTSVRLYFLIKKNGKIREEDDSESEQ